MLRFQLKAVRREIPTMKLKICNCPSCVTKTTKLENGETISGCWVHPSTCAKHWSSYNLPLNTIKNLSSALLSTSVVSRRPETIHLTSRSTNTSKENVSLSLLLHSKRLILNQMTIFHSNHIAFHCMAELGMWCQRNCQIARDWIVFIIEIFQKVPQQPISYLSAYKNVWTITKRLRLNPELERPFAFQNVLASMSQNLPRQPALTADQKNLKLAMKIFLTPLQFFKPCLTYHTQAFESWLGWFLNCSDVEDQIVSWQRKVQSETDGNLLIFNNPKLGKVLQSRTSGSFLETNFDSHSHCMWIGSIHLPTRLLDDKPLWGFWPHMFGPT
ncbi:hypothetical protein VP01_2722g7 [Puccinia sorghi]|uniref:Uncharacterized protein n=1 Tax=Puccinia sorghi TaxID=27349 RepID=A0A0L6V558_9BASI|nr:hypothetical protein VP01_2722g7 [Puccinia sorghi]